MSDRRRRTGRHGEWCATLYLRFHGYRILARDLRTPVAQVDLVASRGPILVLCEVKSRTEVENSTIRWEQRRRLVQAGHWLLDHWGSPGHTRVRIDLITVQFPSGYFALPRVRHYLDYVAADL